MKLRNGRTTASTSGIRPSQRGGIQKQRSTNEGLAVLKEEGKEWGRKKIHLNDTYLTAAIAFLSRDDIDSLPLVSRQFHSVVSQPVFQVNGPCRLLCFYRPFKGGVGTLIVRDADPIRYPRFFAQFSKFREGDIKSLRHYNVVPAKMAENLHRYPWLRAKVTGLYIDQSDKAEIDKDMDAWSQLRNLWTGQMLFVYVSYSKTPYTSVNLSPLAGGCKEMFIGSHLSIVNISLAEWISSGQCKGCQCLELHGGELTIPPSDAANFLFAYNAAPEGRRFLKIAFPAKSYPLSDLIEAIRKRFLSTAHPHSFEMVGRHCRADPVLEEQNFSLKHPTAKGECMVRIRWEKEGQPSQGLRLEVKYANV